MKETKKFLEERWFGNFGRVYLAVTAFLQKGEKIEDSKLPLTEEGFVDLSYYSAPKEYSKHNSNAGRHVKYVSGSICIKNISFQGFDFTGANFERCHFNNCSFKNCKFENTRCVAADFDGCTFNDILFLKTQFSHSTLAPNGIFFKTLKSNFQNVIFEKANLTEVHVHDQQFKNCLFSDCKTGALLFSSCYLEQIKFTGTAKGIFFKKSKTKSGIDFSNAEVADIQIIDDNEQGIIFPTGESYYLFKDKVKELDNIKLLTELSETQQELIKNSLNLWKSWPEIFRILTG